MTDKIVDQEVSLTQRFAEAIVDFWQEAEPENQRNRTDECAQNGGAWIDYDKTIVALGMAAGSVISFSPEDRGAYLRRLQQVAAHSSKCFSKLALQANAISCSMQALTEVIEQHKLKVDDDDNYQITVEMMKEAEALDAAAGRSPLN